MPEQISTPRDSEAPTLSFCQRLKALKSVLLIMFLVGFIVAIPSSIIPMLQEETFQDQSFVITGVLAAVKGFLGFLYIPLLGSFTDLYGRKLALIMVLALSIVPYAVMLLGGFWAYSVTNTFLGLYDGTMTLVMAITTDYIPAHAKVRTESFAMVSAAFFFGVSTAPFLGAFLTTTATFTSAAGAQLFVTVLTFFLLPDDSNRAHHSNEESKLITDADNHYIGDINKCPFLKVVAAEPSDHGSETRASICSEGALPAAAAEGPSSELEPANTLPSAPPAKQQDEVEVVVEGGDDVIAPLPPVDESLPPEMRHSLRAVPRRVWACLKKYPDLRVVVGIVFWNSLTEQMFDKLLLLYLGNNLDFNSTQQAIVIAILGAGGLFGLLVVTGALKHFLGTVGALRTGMIANAVVSVAYCFARAKWQIYAATSLSVVGMGVFPCAAALAASSVSEQAEGVGQGMATAARIAASGISPFAYGLLFQATSTSALPGASFLVGAVCVMLSMLCTRFLSSRIFIGRHH